MKRDATHEFRPAGRGSATAGFLAALLVVIAPVSASSCRAADGSTPRNTKVESDAGDDGTLVDGVRLVWHVEDAAGTVVSSSGDGLAVNPASVVKVATSLWALERLGPSHRFETRFGVTGDLDSPTGILDGDLYVVGAGDPDFHVENAWLVAEALNRLKIHEVRGKLFVGDAFWIGWEGGSERRERDPARRAEIMAERLREAWDPARWSVATRKSLVEFAERRGLDRAAAPRLIVKGGIGRSKVAPGRMIAVHRSNPLRRTLKRFNAYSNNDVERFAESLGTAADLADFLASRWRAPDLAGAFSTLSGLGSNSLSSRHVVRLLQDFRTACGRRGLRVEDLLPEVGCDPGTLKNFPELESRAAQALVAKTGTLTTTDGGVTVLAGYLRTADGERAFSVAAPRSGQALAGARQAEQRWVLDLLERSGGPSGGDCGEPVLYSDAEAEVSPLP